MDVDVGIIYTHERKFMTPLVSSLAQAARGVSMRMILVDNASVDGVGEWRRMLPHVLTLRNSHRLGYAANLNRILEASTARYALLMNTDMYFDSAEQCVSKMVRFMDGNPDCGIAGCGLYHPDGTFGFPARQFQTPATIAIRRLGLSRIFQPAIATYLNGNRPRDAVFECDWLSGCFLMVRRQAADEVGLFDLRFRKYFEDVDYCLRIARAGWRVMINGQTWCYHMEQRASKKLFSQDALIHLQSYVTWLTKWGLHPERQIPAIAQVERQRRAA